MESVQKNLKCATLFAQKVAQMAKNDLRNVSTIVVAEQMEISSIVLDRSI